MSETNKQLILKARGQREQARQARRLSPIFSSGSGRFSANGLRNDNQCEVIRGDVHV